jgi:glycosyltransferase involved in cell wall biosynthesis
MLSGGKPCPSQCGVCSLYAKPKQLASAQVNAAVGVSGFVLQKHVESGFFPRATKTTVINNCYTPVGDSIGRQDSRRQVANAPVRLGMLGRVLPEKGLELLLEQLLADKTLNWTLAVGGTGDADYVESIKTKYADPRVSFLGRVNPPDFLSSIDILVVFPKSSNRTRICCSTSPAPRRSSSRFTRQRHCSTNHRRMIGCASTPGSSVTMR